MVDVSVIIPTYNRKNFVCEAVDSVLEQNFGEFELIVVDDGSDDGTGKVLKSYDEIKYVYQRNQGVSSARNTGVKASIGEFIAFLDSDDLWKEEKLQKQMDYHRKHPEALISQTGEIWYRDGEFVNKKKKHEKVEGWIYEQCLEMCMITPSAVVMKKEIFDKVGMFDEDLPACEDYDLWLRITNRFPVHLIEDRLVVKRGGHGDQLSSSIEALDYYRIQAMKKMLESENLNEEQRKKTVKELETKCEIYAQGCFKRGREDEGRYYSELPDKYRN